jgi:hypothetical protein
MGAALESESVVIMRAMIVSDRVGNHRTVDDAPSAEIAKQRRTPTRTSPTLSRSRAADCSDRVVGRTGALTANEGRDRLLCPSKPASELSRCVLRPGGFAAFLARPYSLLPRSDRWHVAQANVRSAR